MENTKISWCDHSCSFWRGCTKVSPGCAHCYAETLRDGRFGKGEWGPTGVRTPAADSYIAKLERMNAVPWLKCETCGWRGKEADAVGNECPSCGSPRLAVTYQRVFHSSLSDYFETFGPALDLPRWRREGLEQMARLRNMWHLVLTKRIDDVMPLIDQAFGPHSAADWLRANPHVCIGTSVENRDYTWRIEELARIAVAMRWVSFEPLLGSIDLATIPGIEAIAWGIVGGESGPNARPMPPSAAERIVAHQDRLGITTHFKQWGEWVPVSEIGEQIDEYLYRIRPEFRRVAHGARWGVFGPDGEFSETEAGLDADALVEEDFGPVMIRIGKKADPCTIGGKVRRAWPAELI